MTSLQGGAVLRVVLLTGIDERIRGVLAFEAQRLGFTPAVAVQPQCAASFAETNGHDIALAVVGDLFGALTGLDACARLAGSMPQARVVYLSNHIDAQIEQLAVQRGADGVFGCDTCIQHVLTELLVLARRASEPPTRCCQIRVGALTVDAERKRVSIAGRDLELTKTEFSMLLRIVNNQPRITTDEDLITMMKMSHPKRAEWHVRNICKKMNPGAPTKAMIRRRSGEGWSLDENWLPPTQARRRRE